MKGLDCKSTLMFLGSYVDFMLDLSLPDNLVLDWDSLGHDGHGLQLSPVHLLLHHSGPLCHPDHPDHPQLCLLEVHLSP